MYDGSLQKSSSPDKQTYNEYKLDKEADESHNNEADGCSDGNLVELCRQCIMCESADGRQVRRPAVPFLSGFVHLLTRRTLFLAKSLSGVTTVSMSCQLPWTNHNLQQQMTITKTVARSTLSAFERLLCLRTSYE